MVVVWAGQGPARGQHLSCLTSPGQGQVPYWVLRGCFELGHTLEPALEGQASPEARPVRTLWARVTEGQPEASHSKRLTSLEVSGAYVNTQSLSSTPLGREASPGLS